MPLPMNAPKFSIVIPHHNTPDLLLRLLNSVPWDLCPEVVVVDDASSEDVRRELADLQKRFGFGLYRIERHTAGAARNEGLKHVTGEWLLFADADDYFLPEAAGLLRSHVSDNADVVYFRITSTYSDSGKNAYRDRQVTRLFERCRKEHSAWALRALHTNPWGKMIRRQLVESRQIRFEEIPSANDAMFSVRVGVEASAVVIDEHPLYCLTVGDKSMTSNVSKERFESNGEARLRVNAYLRLHQLGQYQLPVLGYMLPSFRYGWKFGWRTVKACFSNGNNPWVDAGRVLNPVNFCHSLKSKPQ